jgi:hypothetical protein
MISLRHLSLAALLGAALFNPTAGWSQSTDPSNPTPWEGYGINSRGNGREITYYYRLNVEPGEVVLNVQARASHFSTGVTVDLLDSGGHPVARGGVIATPDRNEEQHTRLTVTSRQSYLLALHTDANTANYSVWIDRPASGVTPASPAPARRPVVLPRAEDHVNPEALQQARLSRSTPAATPWELSGAGDGANHDYYFDVVLNPGTVELVAQSQARVFSTAVSVGLEDLSGIELRTVGAISTTSTPVRETANYNNGERRRARVHVRVDANCGPYQVMVNGPVER